MVGDEAKTKRKKKECQQIQHTTSLDATKMKVIFSPEKLWKGSKRDESTMRIIGLNLADIEDEKCIDITSKSFRIYILRH